jgi:hypothetical protein
MSIFAENGFYMSFIYNDGGENHLLEIVQSVDFSEDTTWSKYKDTWSLYYHLSPVRKNLLEWVSTENKTDISVLELGSGCGAITSGFVTKKNITKYVAVEGEKRRAEITKKRCASYDFLDVVNCNILDYKSEDKFDFVLVIGVLEYSGRYVEGEDPYFEFLKHATSFLKKDGKLILAIENKLGHKYLAGLNEDHYGKPFIGISNYLYYDGIKTFTKKELNSYFERLGFENFNYYYPFPDYKLPNFIINQNVLKDSQIDVWDIIDFPTVDNSCSLKPLFSERNFMREISQNTDPGIYMNSFLIEISKDDIKNTDFGIIKYSSLRDPSLRNKKVFKESENEWFVSSVGKDNFNEKFHIGYKNLFNLMIDSLLGEDETSFSFNFKIWMKELEKHIVKNISEEEEIKIKEFFKKSFGFDLEISKQEYLPISCLDLIPNNILVKSEEIKVIDLEWKINELNYIPKSLIVNRGIFYLLTNLNAYQEHKAIVNFSWNFPISISIQKNEILLLRLFEKWFQNKVYYNLDILSTKEIDEVYKNFELEFEIKEEEHNPTTFEKILYKIAMKTHKSKAIKKYIKYVNLLDKR